MPQSTTGSFDPEARAACSTLRLRIYWAASAGSGAGTALVEDATHMEPTHRHGELAVRELHRPARAGHGAKSRRVEPPAATDRTPDAGSALDATHHSRPWWRRMLHRPRANVNRRRQACPLVRRTCRRPPAVAFSPDAGRSTSCASAAPPVVVAASRSPGAHRAARPETPPRQRR